VHVRKRSKQAGQDTTGMPRQSRKDQLLCAKIYAWMPSSAKQINPPDKHTDEILVLRPAAAEQQAAPALHNCCTCYMDASCAA
jgi:hypothetical protein